MDETMCNCFDCAKAVIDVASDNATINVLCVFNPHMQVVMPDTLEYPRIVLRKECNNFERVDEYGRRRRERDLEYVVLHNMPF